MVVLEHSAAMVLLQVVLEHLLDSAQLHHCCFGLGKAAWL